MEGNFSREWDFGSTISIVGGFTGKVQLDATLDSEHHNVKVMFDKAFVDKQIDRHWRKIAKNATFKGFRKGHATKRMIESMSGLGEDGMYRPIFHSQLDDRLKECSPRKVMLITAHNDKKQPDGSWTVEAMAFLEPDVEVKCALDKISLTVPKLPRVDEYVTHRIADAVRTHQLLRAKVDKDNNPLPASPGDMSEVKIEAFVDDKRYPDACEEATRIRLEQGKIPAGLFNNLVGAKAGDAFNINTDQVGRFTELTGKMLNLDVQVLRVYTCEEPEVDDELAISAGYDSLEKMEATFTKDASKFIATRDLENKRQTLINYVVAGTTIGAIPDMWLNATMQSYINERRLNVPNTAAFKASIVQATHQYLSFKAAGTMLDVKWDDEDKSIYDRKADKYVEKVLQQLLKNTEFAYADATPDKASVGGEDGSVQGQAA